jgi:hypothetical protein
VVWYADITPIDRKGDHARAIQAAESEFRVYRQRLGSASKIGDDAMPAFKTNLNYFIALFVTGTMFSLWLVAPWVSILLMQIEVGPGAINWVMICISALVFIALIWIWIKHGALSPIALKPNANTRFRAGTVALVISNSLIALSLILSIAGYIFVNGFGVSIGFILSGVLMVSVILNVIGIVCIETTRQRTASKSA